MCARVLERALAKEYTPPGSTVSSPSQRALRAATVFATARLCLLATLLRAAVSTNFSAAHTASWIL